jgi:hypothetical protein
VLAGQNSQPIATVGDSFNTGVITEIIVLFSSAGFLGVKCPAANSGRKDEIKPQYPLALELSNQDYQPALSLKYFKFSWRILAAASS